MYEPSVLRDYNPAENQSEAYSPFEETGDERLPSKAIFEEGMMAEYVVPFEYETKGGTYRYGADVMSKGAVIALGVVAGFLLYQVLFKKK